ncbi:MAG: L,D-transpeptidase family protein [Chitinivibrionales bacterium]|nr:L,D-transpeptidase family protein [Chitinivibrionales bacterium]MBD3358427.1 L,D-transpeptidase family protein [Chitinivibrionales bacterium]
MAFLLLYNVGEGLDAGRRGGPLDSGEGRVCVIRHIGKGAPLIIIACVAAFRILIGAMQAPGVNTSCNPLPYDGPLPSLRVDSIVGETVSHTIKEGETFYDIARAHDVGINDLTALYPRFDPWIPPPGTVLTIPTCWIPPGIRQEGIVINLPELRLYYYHNEGTAVTTYPIGIGTEERVTPQKTFRVSRKIVCPTWTVPPSLHDKYGAVKIPPGPENPLGRYWIGLGNSSYGIHGTNFPWAVGNLVTHGCIRAYPEDIREFFPHIAVGTEVEIIYEPVKITVINGRILIEVHDDIYDLIHDFRMHGLMIIAERRLIGEINLDAMQKALDEKTGLPVDITAEPNERRRVG